MTYASLEQRMANTYLDMLPPFVPLEGAGVGVAQQQEFYVLIKKLYQLWFDQPLLLVPALHEDDAYPNRFNKTHYGKPDLQIAMRKFLKAADALLENMFLLGQGAAVKMNKRQLAILGELGIGDTSGLPAAWTWMANRPGASLTAFTHCLFDPDYPYTSDIYARLLGEEAFRKLEGWMIGRGYRRFDIYDVIASDCKLSLTYANPAWGEERPRGGFEYKIRHTGISARYDAMIARPAVLGLCIPGGLKPYLEAFDRMDKESRGFVVKHVKRCDGCKYCVQTDKTGARPLACIPVEYEQVTYNLCPYFPGTCFCWTELDERLVDRLTGMLSFLDRFAPHSSQ